MLPNSKHHANPTPLYRAWFFFVIFFLGGAVLGKAAPAAPQKTTLVSLGEVAGGPKSQVIVPVFLTPASPETKVGRVSATITFNSKVVTFVRAEKGFLLEGVNGAFKVDLQKDANNSEQSVLGVDIFTQGENRKPLREGMILSLLIDINEDTPAGTNIPLELGKVVASSLDSPPQPIEPLTSKNGNIEVLKPESVPYVACFFFTH